jgi:hypothetical protein
MWRRVSCEQLLDTSHLLVIIEKPNPASARTGPELGNIQYVRIILAKENINMQGDKQMTH